jgi:aspartate kinase
MKVLKFGGTSVGVPERMHDVARIVTAEPEDKIVVLSALSGTTNALVSIGESIERGEAGTASSHVESLYSHYMEYYRNLLSSSAAMDKAQQIVDQHFDTIRSFIDKPFDDAHSKELLAQGELLSTGLFSIYLEEIGVQNQPIPALDFMAIDKNDEPDLEFIRTELNRILKQHPGQTLFVTQGYICLNQKHQIDNLKRGGSDYTASLIGAVLSASCIEIWTDIDGMHNNDPRMVDKTVPIAELSFNEASELAYFGAKILHPSSILPARKFNIPVQLKNTMAPNVPGTRIHSAEDAPQVKAIAAKDGITAIKVKSSRMLLAFGFLRKIFEVFEKYRTPIDMITTSEVAVSLTIDNDAALSHIVEELAPSGEVSIDRNQTIICIVGNQIAAQKGIVKKIFHALDSIPVRMISYGGSSYNVSVLIDTENKKQALTLLNRELFGL